MIALRIGGRYIDRKGNLWTVTTINPGWRYPALAHKSDGDTQSYTMDGRWSLHVDWVNDLVEEATDVVAA